MGGIGGEVRFEGIAESGEDVLIGLGDAPEGNDQQDEFEDVDDDEAEDAEAVQRPNGLPDLVVGIVAGPDGYFREHEQQVDDEEDDGGAGDLRGRGGTILRASASFRFCHTK